MNNTTCAQNDSCTNANLFFDFGNISPDLSNSLYIAYKLWFFVIDVVLILPTIFGNSLILISLIRFKILRKTKAFILIGNLAVSDLLVGLVVIPMDIFLLSTNYFSNDRTYCVWYYCIIYTLVMASVLNLLLLSFERFHAIVRPFQHNLRFTTKRVHIAMGVTWILVTTIGSLPHLGWTSDVMDDAMICRSSLLFTHSYRILVNGIIVVSLTICFVFFIVVIRIALEKTKETNKTNVYMTDISDPNGNRHDSNVRTTLRRDIRHTRLMVLVSGLFIICWGPYCIVSLIPDFSPTLSFARNWLSSLGLINSCLNWIVYGARNKRFRAAFKNILTCSCTRQDEAGISSNST